LGLLGIGALRTRALPRGLAVGGLVAALALAALMLPHLRIDLPMPVAAAVTLLSLWMWCTGGWLLLRRRG
jgi:hypothetical protein